MVGTVTKKLIRDLWSLKWQVFTIALVVCSGISVLIASVSTYDSLNRAQQNFYSHYHFSDIFVSLKRAPNSIQKRLQEVPGISLVDTRIVYDATLDIGDLSEPAIGRFISLSDNSEQKLNALYLKEGRWPQEDKSNEVVVNESFALANRLMPGDYLYALLNGHRQKLQIVGVVLSPEFVYAIKGDDILPDNKHFGIFWMPYKSLASVFTMQNAFNSIVISIAPQSNQNQIIDSLERILQPYGLISSYSQDEQISNRFVSNEIKQQKIIATFIPTLFISVAAFLLNIVIGRLVFKQRQQIATLKALGYENLTIGLYYLKFVLVIVFIGAIAGVLLGAWLGKQMTFLYAEYFRFPNYQYYLNPWIPIFGIGLSFLAASTGALNSILQVNILAPAIAMRPTIVGTYKAVKLEKSSFFKKMSISAKLIVRYFFRHPIRMLLTIIGIGLSMTMVILGLFWNDAINYIIKQQFQISQRENATLTFTEPLDYHVLLELRNIDGILAVEGYRMTAIKIKHLNMSDQIMLFGMPPDSKLKQVLNLNGTVIAPGPYQILLSKGLAEKLQVNVGQNVELEFLEQTRPKTQLKVTGLVDDYIGVAAYADIQLVNRILSEDRIINAAGILVDQTKTSKIYKALKELPKVTTVTFKSSIINAFKETFAKHILVFTTILASFAVVIAVGVVYNNTRITMAERNWELATLRVIGLTESEVSHILLGNIVVEFILAIPLGLLLGYEVTKGMLFLMQTDWFKIPFIIEPKTYALSVIVVIISGILSGFVAQREIKKLDLTIVLKVTD